MVPNNGIEQGFIWIGIFCSHQWADGKWAKRVEYGERTFCTVLSTVSKHGRIAMEYLNYGKLIDSPVAGAVVVGKDGKHVGIFISTTEFIHSSTSKMKVIKASLEQLPYVFPLGYEFRMEWSWSIIDLIKGGLPIVVGRPP